jgi:thiol-disulfide isomerase/thioredoxin
MRTLAAWMLLSFTVSGAELKPVDEAGFPAMVAAFKGKVLLVNFWATYCVPCRKEMPGLVAMQSRLGVKGFQLVTVSADEPEQETQAKAFLDKTKVPAPAYIKKAKDDDRFISSVDKKWSGALPLSILYDRQGGRVKVWYGEVPIKELEAAVGKLL